jgi:hypothetical protein
MSACFFAIEFRVRVSTEDVFADRSLDFPVGVGHGASVCLLLGNDASSKVFHGCVTRADDDILERAYRTKPSNAIDVEPVTHGRSMTRRTASVKRRCCTDSD